MYIRCFNRYCGVVGVVCLGWLRMRLGFEDLREGTYTRSRRFRSVDV